MANYFNTLNLRQQLAQLGKCRFMGRDEFADGADALGEILAEPCLRFCQLLLEVIIYVCHMLSDFFPLVLLFCSLTEGMFLLFQRAGSHQ